MSEVKQKGFLSVFEPCEESEHTVESMEKTTHYSVNQVSVVEIEQLLVQQYNTEFVMEMSQEVHVVNAEDNKVCTVDGHYCIGLPLRDEAVKMPNKRCMAEQRVASLNA